MFWGLRVSGVPAGIARGLVLDYAGATLYVEARSAHRTANTGAAIFGIIIAVIGVGVGDLVGAGTRGEEHKKMRTWTRWVGCSRHTDPVML
jgi:hypothetical protein